MTIPEIIFLAALAGAYLIFMAVLAWVSHQTNKYLKDKERQASDKPRAGAAAGDLAQPLAQFDRAA